MGRSFTIKPKLVEMGEKAWKFMKKNGHTLFFVDISEDI
jgi:hypothetical protein